MIEPGVEREKTGQGRRRLDANTGHLEQTQPEVQQSLISS